MTSHYYEKTGRKSPGALPDFLIIGAQKSGTTALRDTLASDARVHMAVSQSGDVGSNELHFFDKESNWQLGLDWYRQYFDKTDLLQGEKTPEYLSSAKCHRRMVETVPNARLVVLLRNPVDRAYSQWNHFNQEPHKFRHLGWEPVEFELAVKRAFDHPESIYHQLIRTGRYAESLASLFEYFPREQVHVTLSERLRTQPGAELERILDFLGLEDNGIRMGTSHTRAYDRRQMPKPVRHQLEAYFEPYNRWLRDLLEDSIPEWVPVTETSRQHPGLGMPVGIGLVSTCKGRLHHLRETLPTFASQSDCDVVVVDYGCPDGTADHIKTNYREDNVNVLRVDADEWNKSRAQNAGAEATESEWLVFVDADTHLPPDFAERLKPELRKGCFHVLIPRPRTASGWKQLSERQRDLFGFIVCQRSDFEQISGFDPAFRGWGGEDLDLRLRLDLIGRRECALPIHDVEPILHSDQERVQYADLKGRSASDLLNRIYREIKFDLIRLINGFPPEDSCIAIYDRLMDAVARLVRTGEKQQVTVEAPSRSMAILTIRQRLAYQLVPEDLSRDPVVYKQLRGWAERHRDS